MGDAPIPSSYPLIVFFLCREKKRRARVLLILDSFVVHESILRRAAPPIGPLTQRFISALSSAGSSSKGEVPSTTRGNYNRCFHDPESNLECLLFHAFDDYF